MRTLEKNKKRFWIINALGKEAEIINGKRTGNYVTTYSEPVEVRFNIYPSNGDIEQEIFGKVLHFDMIATTIDVELKHNSLVFDTLPTDNFNDTYTYSVGKINQSLNSCTYGLIRRV